MSKRGEDVMNQGLGSSQYLGGGHAFLELVGWVTWW